MPLAESILPEFDQETLTTRLLLERVPGEKGEWKPHDESRSLGQLAMHIAGIPRWAAITLERKEFDTNPPDTSKPVPPVFESTARALMAYDDAVTSARSILTRTSDGEFMAQWTLKNGGKSVFSVPRVAAFRSFVMNHAVHHRGQLSVYLRLLDVPLPTLYGVTAD